MTSISFLRCLVVLLLIGYALGSSLPSNSEMKNALAAGDYSHPNPNYTAGVPAGYYKNINHTPKSYEDLKIAIGDGFVHPYQKDVFDCSEMSAYVEHKLENLGFNAWICSSEHFKGDRKHSWVGVDITDYIGINKGIRTYYVETTAHNHDGFDLIIKRPNNLDYDYYRSPEHIFNDIYEACLKNEDDSEWDFWNVLGFKQ